MLTFGSKYKKFWKWFEAHEHEIFNFEADQERVFDKLADHLQHVHRNLVFEFSSITDGMREFIISAGGIKEAFPAVTALVRESPPLPRWKIIAFRQRHEIPSIQCGDINLNHDAVFFDYAEHGNRIDITVFLPGIVNSTPERLTALKTVGYLFLDAAVGEYDVETKIAGIEFVDATIHPQRRRLPLRELPEILDALPMTVR